MADTNWLSAEEEAELRVQERGRQAALDTMRSTLLRQLAHRFGPVSHGLTVRIASCEDTARLEAALISVVTIKSLHEFSI